MKDFNDVIGEVIEDVKNFENIQAVIDIMEEYYSELELGVENEQDVINKLKEIGEEKIIDRWIKPSKPKQGTWKRRISYILEDLKFEKNKNYVVEIISDLDEVDKKDMDEALKYATEELKNMGEDDIASKWLDHEPISYICRKFKRKNYHIE